MQTSPNNKPVIETASGEFVDPLRPEGRLRLTDIAHALSQIPRFGGHGAYHYSVAQHSILVADITSMLCDHINPKVQLAALLHDAAEAYLGDMPRPLKKEMPYFQQTETNLQEAIFATYKLSLTIPEVVHQADYIALYLEAERLMKNHDQWGMTPPNDLMVWRLVQQRSVVPMKMAAVKRMYQDRLAEVLDEY